MNACGCDHGASLTDEEMEMEVKAATTREASNKHEDEM